MLALAQTIIAATGLSGAETIRYSRHLALPEVGMAGQLRLAQARVLLIGVGGLGSPVALYLAAAGIGTLGLVDSDRVDVTNLHRQVLYGTRNVGSPKLEAAADRIGDLNPHVKLELHETRLSSANALEILAQYDVIVDGTDNFATRYLTNDACVLLRKPNVFGSIFRFDGQITVLATETGPCYRCLYPAPPPPGAVPSCAEGGVLGVLPGIVGTLQATETIKLILGIGQPLVGRLMLVDALEMSFRELRIRKDPMCPVCATREIRSLVDHNELCGVTNCGEHAGKSGDIQEIEPAVLAMRVARGEELQIIDVREPHEWEICRINGARLIPLSSLGAAISTLDSSRDIIVVCRSGARASVAVKQLREAGLSRAVNLAGGLLRWSTEVDPSVTRY